MAQKEPVVIQNQGQDVAVVLSAQDFKKITHDNIEGFLEFCRLIGQKATDAGITEEELRTLPASEE
jgi:hypothetical protein